MEDRLASMTQKMLDLQFRYLDMQEQSSQEIAQLHNRIAELMGRKNQQKGEYINITFKIFLNKNESRFCFVFREH
jgi:hypothetical protein